MRWVWGILGVAGVAAGLYYTGLLRLNFPSEKQFPVRGIDVSHHQGHIGWFEASLHDVKFAYIKATEGTDFRDPEFQYNWSQGPYNHIHRGAYHFYNFCKPGKPQARNFLSFVPADSNALPPALDLEFSANCRKKPSYPEFKREIIAFMKEIAPRYPGPPVLYVTEEVYKRYLEGHRQEFPPHLLWIVDLVKAPRGTPCEDWTFWQYGALGRVPGVKGPTDLNVYCGSPEEFARFSGIER